MNILSQIVITNILISLLSFVGILTASLTFLKKQTSAMLLIGFSAGVLLATAFLNILPEAFEGIAVSRVLFWTMIGMIGAFLMERSLLWYHHHHDDSHNINPTTLLILVGDSVHNFIDGIAIAAAFLANPALGVTTAFAIAAHEIPQELADFAILKNSGMSRNKALLFNFISALFAVIGGFTGYYIFQSVPNFLSIALAITAGIFIYISAADLIPELHGSKAKSNWLGQTICFLLGVGLMYIITVNAPHSHAHDEESQYEIHMEELIDHEHMGEHETDSHIDEYHDDEEGKNRF